MAQSNALVRYGKINVSYPVIETGFITNAIFKSIHNYYLIAGASFALVILIDIT